MKKKVLLFFCFVFVGQFLLAQPSNDNCSGAISLDTLNNPASCGGAISGIMSGTTTTIAGTLNGATPENPYVAQSNCAGGSMAAPANDVWYSFICPSNGSQVTITISGASFTPNIALWQGTCNALIGRGCAIGSGGVGTFTASGINPGQVYYVQVSGNTGETGNFSLSAYAWQDCSECNVSSTLTVTPMPTNGTYQPGQTVQLCYHVSDWNQINVNWLHGVQVTFGSGWNAASLAPASIPPPCSGSGTWLWEPTGEGVVNGINWGTGFYFDLDNDGNPTNNFGDNCQGMQPDSVWDFCVKLTVGNTCNPGADLSVNFHTTGDGESGSWSDNGCSNDPTTNFSAVQACCPPTVTSSSVHCNGGTTGSMTATATTGGAGAQNPYVFAWTGAASATNTVVAGLTNTFPNVPAGIYTVTVTDKNLCAASVTVSVVQPPPITASLTPTNATCIMLGSINTAPASGVPPYTYAWSGPGSYTSTTQDPTGLSAGIYTLDITDAQGCVGIDTTTVHQIGTMLTVTVTSASVCVGASAPLIASGPATGYTWTPAMGLNVTSGASVLATPSTTTSYTVLGANGTCTASAVATVTVYPIPTFSIIAPPVCIGTSININTVPSTFSSYTIQTFPTYTTTSMPVVFPANQVENIQTSMTVANNNGCINTHSFTVTVNPLPIISAYTKPVCVGLVDTLNASGAGATGTYTWVPITNLSSMYGSTVYATPENLNAITYTVSGMDNNGCVNTDTVRVLVNPLPVLTISPDTVKGCVPQCAVYTVQATTAPAVNGAYRWFTPSGGGATIASPSVCYNQIGTGNVKLLYTDINGCQNTDWAHIITYSVPKAQFDYEPKPVTILSPNVSFENQSYNIMGGALTYTWNFGDTLGNASISNVLNPSHWYQNMGSHLVSLIATSINGCVDTTYQTVVIENDFALYVPNSFTPNGDGKNEIFEAIGDGVAEYSIFIFDRWGNQVFTSTDMNQGWNGAMNNKGSILQTDVYAWKIQLRTFDHRGYTYAGTVALLQ